MTRMKTMLVLKKQVVGIKIGHNLIFMINSDILQNTEVRLIGLWELSYLFCYYIQKTHWIDYNQRDINHNK